MPTQHDNLRLVLKAHPSRQRGQTVVIALLVLVLLSFVGALFITIVASNITNQSRSQRTLNADYYAQAGLRYADSELTNSLQGADWRPPLQYQATTGGPSGGALATDLYNAQNLQPVNANDPDAAYLNQGFSRYDTEGGRFLLKVSYDPIANSSADNPSARYIEIQSIGREGEVTPDDPTTYTNQPASTLVATDTAYKPIGITDYARFETNLNNRSGVMNIGVPSAYTPVASNNAPSGIVTPGVFDFNVQGGALSTSQPLLPYAITTTYGAQDAYLENPTTGAVIPYTTTPVAADAAYTQAVSGGGSIRANGDVRFYGVNDVYLSRPPATGSPNPAPFVQDDIEVAGRILLDGYDSNATLDNTTPDGTTGQTSALIVNPPATGTVPLGDYITPSNDATGFNTDAGAARDGGSGSSADDANGYPRSIARLAPPVATTVNPATHLTRYQALTENSPERMFPSISGGVANDSVPTTPDANAGEDGLGTAIYVNNINDIQRDSGSLVGGQTLVDDWLNGANGGQSSVTAKNGWDGPFYNPPGVDLSFGLQTESLNGTPYSFYGIKLTRTDTDSNGVPQLFPLPGGSSATELISYHDLYASNNPAAYVANEPNPDNDIVIYCEGNVRIKPSMLSADAANDPTTGEPTRLYNINGGTGAPLDDTVPRHITVVTNGTAYIEGSILKGNADSSITIIAKDYVCLNTSQFYAGALADSNPQSTQPPSVSLENNALLDFGPQNDVLVQDFVLDTLSTTYPYTSLYISGGPSAPGTTQVDFDIVNPATGLSINPTAGGPYLPFQLSLESVTFNTIGNNGAGAAGPSGLTDIALNINDPGYSYLANYPGQMLQLWTRMDPGGEQSLSQSVAVAGTQDYAQARSAILPMDIEIQAVLYAQDKSFFVIPGPWFNSDESDNLSTYASDLENGHNDQDRPGISSSADDNAAGYPTYNSHTRYPFNGQPVDLKITIDGAVSENEPANISAQAAWMQKWGWIPQFHGSQSAENNSTDDTADFEDSGHDLGDKTTGPTEGLTLLYDPEAGYPFDPTTGTYLRYDRYGRPLPFTPDLPVSTGLLYAGQGTAQTVPPTP